MGFYKKQFITYFSILLAIGLAWNVGLAFYPNEHFKNLYLLMYIVFFLSDAAIILAYSIKVGLYTILGKGLLCLGIGLILRSASFGTILLFPIFLGHPVPLVSINDILLVSMYGTLFLCMRYLLNIFQTFIKTRFIIEASGIFIVTTILYAYPLFSQQTIFTITSSWFIKLLTFFYAIADTLLLALAYLLVRVSGGRLHKSLVFFVAAMISMIFGLAIINYAAPSSDYLTSIMNPNDVPFTLGVFFASLGMVYVVESMLKFGEKEQLAPWKNLYIK